MRRRSGMPRALIHRASKALLIQDPNITDPTMLRALDTREFAHPMTAASSRRAPSGDAQARVEPA
jgi:hypothetical protein